MATRSSIDYTQMELGTVTWRGTHGRMHVIARCAKCGKHGERMIVIPHEAARHFAEKPRVMWHHRAVQKRTPIGSFVEIVEGCGVGVDKTNVDDLLNIRERTLYDAFVAQLRDYVDQF